MENISVDNLFGLYIDTINHCGEFLLKSEDEEIGYRIFEEFDIGAISFLHEQNLKILVDEGMIDNATSDLSKELRAKFMKLQGSSIWGVEFVKTSKEWLEIMKLSDKIREAVK